MLINANALSIPLAAKSVHTIVTSPPYYGLRDYGVDGQIGLEVTPDEYIANLVSVFRECKRILRDDGTLWVNIGDSYFSKPKSNYNGKSPGLQSKNYGTGDTALGYKQSADKYLANKRDGMKDKDLIGIPWMLAFALRADGWYLRQDIIWHKPNPMPESVKERCTKAHEYIFLLSKSARYYYDNDALREPLAASTLNDIRIDCMSGRPNKKAHELVKNGTHGSGGIGDPTKKRSELINLAGRNKRDVWTVTTKPYKGAHYATFNPELIKPCILAGAPEGGIVFDPFVGSGTTVATAIQLGRKGIGIDLSFKYLQENAKARVESAELPLLNFIEQ